MRHLIVIVVLSIFSASSGLAQVPTPAAVWGFEPGTDYRLGDYEMVHRYFRALANASDRVVLDTIGYSSLNKPLLLAVISSKENINNRERYREISRRLALTTGLNEVEAETLAREGKAIVWVDGGLHATEVAHGQFTPVFAHWLATDESEEARRIRDDVIVLLMPNMNPDGLDIVVDWYRQNVGTPYETSRVPELYHHYIGHDNNRDWYMFTQAETKAVANQLYHVWFPQIVYNHHQSGPFPGRIWVPPFENPVNPNLDPLVVTSINQIGETMKRRFAREGKRGVSSGIVYDMWWNGSMRGAPDFHNMLGFLTETALYRYATPYCYDETEIPDTFGARSGNLPAKRPTTLYPDPWLGGCWHLKDPIEYMMTATRAVTDLASRYREDYLWNIYHIGRRQIARGEHAEGGPFAYVIDTGKQHDTGVAVALLQTFRQGGIEIRMASQEFTAGGQNYPAGTFVIPPQAFRPFVIDLMEPKEYPDRRQYPGGPPEPPYDMTGYELSLQMGVRADRVMEPFEMPGPPVETVPIASGGLVGGGEWGLLLAPNQNVGVVAINRSMAAGADISRSATDFVHNGRTWAAGTWLIRGLDVNTARTIGEDLGVRFHGITSEPTTAFTELERPKVALYEGYMSNMPAGWTRWMFEQYEFAFESVDDDDIQFEQYEFAFESVDDDDIQSGKLADFDVLILSDQNAESIAEGHAPGSMPPEYTGGLGQTGVAAIQSFVRQGGVLAAFDNAIDFAIDQFALPVENATAGLSQSDFFIPGSLLRIDVDPSDPVTYGMPEKAIAFFVRSQVIRLRDGAANRGDVDVFARYAEDDFLASGWAHGAGTVLAGQIAGARVAVGSGEVVLFAFEPQFRGQPHNTFKLLFNVLFHAAAQQRTRPSADW